MAQQILEIKHLSKAFGKNVVLRDIDFFYDGRITMHAADQESPVQLFLIHGLACQQPIIGKQQSAIVF